MAGGASVPLAPDRPPGGAMRCWPTRARPWSSPTARSRVRRPCAPGRGGGPGRVAARPRSPQPALRDVHVRLDGRPKGVEVEDRGFLRLAATGPGLCCRPVRASSVPAGSSSTPGCGRSGARCSTARGSCCSRSGPPDPEAMPPPSRATASPSSARRRGCSTSSSRARSTGSRRCGSWSPAGTCSRRTTRRASWPRTRAARSSTPTGRRRRRSSRVTTWSRRTRPARRCRSGGRRRRGVRARTARRGRSPPACAGRAAASAATAWRAATSGGRT